MTKAKPSRGILDILAAFRDSEDCDGDPSRPTTFPRCDEFYWSKVRSAIRAKLIRSRPISGGCVWVQLTDSGLALFRSAFPDHPYSRDWADSERERLARLEYIVHVIWDGGRKSVNDVIAEFTRDYFDSPRTVESVASDWDASRRESFGSVTFAEDDDYHRGVFRFRYNRERGIWEFRKALA